MRRFGVISNGKLESSVGAAGFSSECLTAFIWPSAARKAELMNYPYEATLIQVEQFLREELPNFAVARCPALESDFAGGVFRLSESRKPEQVIQIEGAVLDDFQPDDLIRQLRAHGLCETILAACRKELVRLDESPGTILILISGETKQRSAA